MADIIHSTAFERDDTPEAKWQAAWEAFRPTLEEWRGEGCNAEFIARARAEREIFMAVPAPTISALATKMMVADASDDDHHDLCLADLRMIEWRELVAAYDAAKEEEVRLAPLHDEAQGAYFELKKAGVEGPGTEAAHRKSLETEEAYDAAVDASEEAWRAILDFPPPTGAAFGIKTRLVCKERQLGRIEDGPALAALLSDVQRLLDCGQFPGWNEYAH